MKVEEVRLDMYDKIKSIHKRQDEILSQVKITNGRVNKLEAWKDQFVGGAKVLLGVVGLLGFVLKMGWMIIK